ncbi:hypothetical protein D9758_007680 [Tetrapyrgos nigripes]|uniref:beta-glucosidase n=1 Tax=Tetrapyrgos nigripes TaxID=182062 RepID=A0A8H5G5K0_9AGAR|nr:hypothetical protein D9758_007680 [Tetrapyrgos nigripes]
MTGTVDGLTRRKLSRTIRIMRSSVLNALGIVFSIGSTDIGPSAGAQTRLRLHRDYPERISLISAAPTRLSARRLHSTNPGVSPSWAMGVEFSHPEGQAIAREVKKDVPGRSHGCGVGHSVLLSHASAVQLYRSSFKPTQKGQIGITLNGDWQMPWDQSPENVEAAQRALDVAIGWFADPVYLGSYPSYLRQMLGDRLPEFTPEERKLVHGSSDFYGMNTYTTNLCRAGGDDEFQGLVDYTFTRPDGTQLGTQAHCAWLQDYPQGFRALLNYLYNRYHTPIYVTENGFAVKDENAMPREHALKDTDRVNYFKGTTQALLDAITEDGVDIRAYFPWSLLDNFEWADGYVTRFGLTYVDYETQKRYPKESAWFLVNWFKGHLYVAPPTPPPPAINRDSSSTSSVTVAKKSGSTTPDTKAGDSGASSTAIIQEQPKVGVLGKVKAFLVSLVRCGA